MVELLTKKYGGEIYKHYFLMVLIPVICNALFAKCSLLSRYYFKFGDNIDQRNRCIPKQYYMLMSVLFLVSMLCANASLAYISFPTQLIMKSSKPISIVLCGLIFVRKAYSYHRLISALIIVISVSMFMYEQYTAQPHSQASHPNSLADTTNSKFGIVLLNFWWTVGHCTRQTKTLLYSANVWNDVLRESLFNIPVDSGPIWF